jgi:mRNA-degrading endonuclease toxin of MazEF toxin-antitoxin module
VNLEPVSPPAPGKTRPAIVISNSDQNTVLQSVIVIPLSSQAPEIWPLRLRLDFPTGKPSFAVLPGMRPVGKARIQEVAGVARAGDMDRIDEAVLVYLSD